MKSGKQLIYWDACLLLAWITNEQWGEEICGGIEEIANSVDNGECNLITSCITRTEVFVGSLSAEEKEVYTNVFRRRNVEQISVTPRIADKAALIREHYSKLNLKIAAPDAIHLATAIIQKVDVLYTLDGAGRRRRPHQMLRLDGNVAGEVLSIKAPKRTPPPPPIEEPTVEPVLTNLELFGDLDLV